MSWSNKIQAERPIFRYGFVTFDENEDIAALVRKKTIVMKGKKLRVRKAIRRNGSQFVDNSSPEVSPRKFYKANSLLFMILFGFSN